MKLLEIYNNSELVRSRWKQLKKQLERTGQVPVELAQIDWRSTLVILQAQAKQEAECGNEEIANEIQKLGRRIAVQL